MNHDFDNEFETDDELKKDAAAERRKEIFGFRTHRQNGQNSRCRYGKRKPDCCNRKEPLKDHYHLYCGRDHCFSPDRRRLVWKTYDVHDADRL